MKPFYSRLIKGTVKNKTIRNLHSITMIWIINKNKIETAVCTAFRIRNSESDFRSEFRFHFNRASTVQRVISTFNHHQHPFLIPSQFAAQWAMRMSTRQHTQNAGAEVFSALPNLRIFHKSHFSPIVKIE